MQREGCAATLTGSLWCWRQRWGQFQASRESCGIRSVWAAVLHCARRSLTDMEPTESTKLKCLYQRAFLFDSWSKENKESLPTFNPRNTRFKCTIECHTEHRVLQCRCSLCACVCAFIVIYCMYSSASFIHHVELVNPNMTSLSIIMIGYNHKKWSTVEPERAERNWIAFWGFTRQNYDL